MPADLTGPARTASAALSRLKYWASRRLPPKAYWYVMGRFKPVPAVTSAYSDVESCLASGAEVVALLDGFDVVRPDAVTLQIGSGLGRVEYHLRNRVERCFGIDISASMVKRARELVPFPDVEFFETDGSGIGRWSDGSFDLVYSFLVFQHMPRSDFHRYVGETFAKLRPGGHFVFQLMIDEAGTMPDPPAAHPYGLRYYRRADVIALLTATGFEDVRLGDMGGRPDDGRTAGDVVFCATKTEAAAGRVRGRVILVTPRPPRLDGQGDQIRAAQILAALADEWEIEVVSWVPDIEHSDGGRHRPIVLLKAVLLSIRRPFQVSYMQVLMPRPVRRRLAAARDEVSIFVTSRAVPRVLPARAVVDFVDDLGGAARRRAEAAPGLGRRLFWTLESRRTRGLDRRLAQRATVSVAISEVDAANIAPTVRVVPNSIRTPPLPPGGDKVLFSGNLFFEPNHEAAVWICTDLVPYLVSVGVPADRVVIAGRRPQASLQDHAARAGIDLRPDLPDLATALQEASVVIAPVTLGSGVQTKVLEAVGAGRPCVLSPKANDGLGLIDGRSGLVRDRDPKPFGDAIVLLLHDPALGPRLVEGARAQLTAFTQGAAASAWRAVVADCAAAGAQKRETSR